MGNLEALISELCPAGVKFMEIGQFADCTVGATPSTSNPAYWEAGYIPWMSSGEVNFETIYSTEKFITKLGYESSSTKLVPANSVVVALAGQGKTRGMVARIRIELCTNQSLCAITCDEQVSSDYLFYYLKSQYVQLRTISSGDGTRGGLNLKMIKSFKVPVPPMEVQLEIVRILDAMTSLQAELQAELAARQKQYEYYRDSLLNFDAPGTPSVRWMTLGDVVRIRNGRDYKHLGAGETPVYGSGGVMTLVDTALYDKPSVLIPRKGSLSKLYFLDVPFWTVDTIFYTEIDESLVLPKFVFYFLATRHLEELNEAGGVPSLTQSVLNKQPFPVPPLREQERIVGILDKFDELTAGISTGLPAEIEARRKQYEYYRDKLLTFKELPA